MLRSIIFRIIRYAIPSYSSNPTTVRHQFLINPLILQHLSLIKHHILYSHYSSNQPPSSILYPPDPYISQSTPTSILCDEFRSPPLLICTITHAPSKSRLPLHPDAVESPLVTVSLTPLLLLNYHQITASLCYDFVTVKIHLWPINATATHL